MRTQRSWILALLLGALLSSAVANSQTASTTDTRTLLAHPGLPLESRRALEKKIEEVKVVTRCRVSNDQV